MITGSVSFLSLHVWILYYSGGNSYKILRLSS